MTGKMWLEDIQSSFLGFIAAMVGIAPRLVPYLVVIFALLLVVGHVSQNGPSSYKTFLQPLVAIGALFCIYALLSGIWSQNLNLAAEAAGLLWAMIAVAVYAALCLINILSDLPEPRRRRIIRALPVGGLVAIGFLLFELVTNDALTTTALQIFPQLTGLRGKGLVFQDGVVVDVQELYSNRNVAALVLIAVPLLFATWLWMTPKYRLHINLGLAAAITVVVFFSASETSKVSWITALLIFALARQMPKQVGTGLAIALTIAVLFAVPLGRLPYALGLHEAAWLPKSARDRVLIWDYTASAVLKHPITGVGAQSTRYVDAKMRKTQKSDKQKKQKKIFRRAGWHAHNIYLQTWLELGAIGAALLLAFGLALIRAIRFLSESTRPWAYAMAAVIIVSGMTGWGMWQAWYLGTMCLGIFSLIAFDSEVRRREATIAAS